MHACVYVFVSSAVNVVGISYIVRVCVFVLCGRVTHTKCSLPAFRDRLKQIDVYEWGEYTHTHMCDNNVELHMLGAFIR